MKKNLFVAGMLSVLLFSCQKEKPIQEETKLSPPESKSVAITDPNDVNLNVNWKWYDPNLQNVTIYYGAVTGGQPVPSTTVSLPWFTQGNPINDPTLRDYRPELGWTLYLKDFGTASRPAETPFFALYNKYSGTLRIFIYNYRVRNGSGTAYSYYIGELGFNNTSNYNENLSFLAPMSQFVSEKSNPNLKQMVVTKTDASDTWVNLDFTLARTSRTFGTSPEFKLSVYGANKTDLALGTDFSTLSAKSSTGASGNSVSGFANFITNGYEYISSGESFLQSIDKLNTKTGSTSSSNANINSSQADIIRPQAIALPAIIKGVGVVKGFLGLVKSFTGGSKSASNTQTTLQYSGIVNTTGTATTTAVLYSIQFNPDFNAPLSPNHYVPLFKQPVGIIAPIGRYPLLIKNILFQNCSGYGTAVMNYYINREAFSNLDGSFSVGREGLRLDSVKSMVLNNKELNRDPDRTMSYEGSFDFLSLLSG